MGKGSFSAVAGPLQGRRGTARRRRVRGRSRWRGPRAAGAGALQSRGSHVRGLLTDDPEIKHQLRRHPDWRGAPAQEYRAPDSSPVSTPPRYFRERSGGGSPWESNPPTTPLGAAHAVLKTGRSTGTHWLPCPRSDRTPNQMILYERARFWKGLRTQAWRPGSGSVLSTDSEESRSLIGTRRARVSTKTNDRHWLGPVPN